MYRFDEVTDLQKKGQGKLTLESCMLSVLLGLEPGFKYQQKEAAEYIEQYFLLIRESRHF